MFLDVADYTSAVLFGMTLVTMANWFSYARRNYDGPSVVLLAGT